MADYSVDIKLAVAGAKQLKAARAETTALSKEINTLNKLANKQSKTLPNSFNTLNKVLGQAKGNLNKVALGTERYFRAIGDVIDKEKRVNQAIRRQATDLKVVQRLKTKGLEINTKNIQLVRKELADEIKLARAKERTAKANRAKGKSAMMARGMGGNLQNAIGSGIIGGGFPLLFGQGPTAALGGGIGGLAGGLIGGQMGFALSIAGTTIGGALDDLANALAKPTENIEKLVEKFGLVGTETGDLALELEELGLKSAAAALLLEKGRKEFGLSSEEIEENTKKMTDFKNEINKFGTALTLLMSKTLGPLITEINNLIEGKKPKGISRGVTGAIDFFTANMFDLDKRGGILDEGIGKKAANTILFGPGGDPTKPKRLMGNISAAEGEAVIGGVKLNPNFGKKSDIKIDTRSDTEKQLELLKEQAKFEQNIAPIQQRLEIEKNRFKLNSAEINVLKEENKLTSLRTKLGIQEQQLVLFPNDLKLKDKIEILKTEVSLQRQILENAQILADPIQAQTIQLDQQMRVLMDRGSQIVALSQTISQSFERSFMGIINGTMSVNDAFRNMLGSIANHFAQTAAKMMANQLQRGLLGFLGNTVLGAFGGGGGGSAPFITDTFLGGGGSKFLDFAPALKFANGGRPPVGKASIVGERGPELFVPNTAGTIVPNHAMGGTTNIIINVDASSSSSDGEQGQANDIGNAFAAAIQTELINQKRPGGLLSNA